MMLWHFFTESRESREKSSKLCNYARTPIKDAEKFWVSENTKFKTGQTREVYLQIPALFLHLNAVDMRHIRQDFRIRLEFANSASVVVSGDRTNLSLDNLDVVIKSFAEESYDYQHRMNRLKNNKHKYLYLDHERLIYNDKTLTAGATTKFALDQFVGKCPFIIVVIKPNNSPVASDKSLIDFVEIGEDGMMYFRRV